MLEQLMFEKALFEQETLKEGDCFAIIAEATRSKRGNNVLKVEDVLWVNPCISWESAQNISDGTKGYGKYAQLNARNAGSQLKIFKLKKDLIAKLSTVLEQENFENIKCNVLEKERTSSAIPVFQTKEKSSDKAIYLRITPENQLKQASAILLKSVYTIDNVFITRILVQNINLRCVLLNLFL